MRELLYSTDDPEYHDARVSPSVGQMKVNWLSIKEVLTCLATHLPDSQQPYVAGMKKEEEISITRYVKNRCVQV